ncbi:multicopper oxidase type 2 (plasmid) [Leptolyngbya sp. NIES-3755]|nr:multicopper oxidase type 2 [Leptolyngbya sp. NIES-3755]
MVTLLDPKTQPKFINDLPIPPIIDATNGGTFRVTMQQGYQWLGLTDPGADGEYGTTDDQRLYTSIWGYGLAGQGPTFPGPTFIAQSGVPIKVFWQNRLPKGDPLLPVDPTLLDSDQLEALSQGYIPTVVHLHGGNTEADSDGYPDAWFTQDYAYKGADWVKKKYTYGNQQEAATLWYHDHTNGMTRLNVNAGLAGGYILRDANENRLIQQNVLPSGAYEQELMLQDRMFTSDGQFYMPPDDSVPGEPANSISPEFFGDTMLVNGMAWPRYDVEPRKYRFQLINGSDSRTYVLQFDNPNEKFYEIGSGQGFLDHPLALDRIVLAPAQRLDVVVDFSDNPMGDRLTLRNFGSDEPFAGLDDQGNLKDDRAPADPDTTGQIMQFVVDKPLSATPIATLDTQNLMTALRSTPLTTPVQTGPTESVVMFESEDQFGRVQPRMGNLEAGSLLWTDPITERVELGKNAVWELYNTTADAHAIHLHSAAFVMLNRQSFTGNVIEEGEDSQGGKKQYLRDVQLSGDPQNPDASEQGWQDTVIVNPGEVVRVITRNYTNPGTFDWHCHLLSHQDNNMMRPFEVVAPSDNSTNGELDPGMYSALYKDNLLQTAQLPNSTGQLSMQQPDPLSSSMAMSRY